MAKPPIPIFLKSIPAGSVGLLLILLVLGGTGLAASGKTVRIGVPIDFPPFSYQDEGESEVRGYSVDVLNILCAKLSTEPRFLVGRNEDLLRALKDGDLDLVVGVMLEGDQRKNFNFLEIRIFVKRYTFLHHARNESVRPFDSDKESVVVVKGQPYITPGLFDRKVNLIQTRTVKEALMMVNSGRAREFVDFSNHQATYLIGKHGLQDIRQAGVRMGEFPLTMVTAKDNAALNSGLSLALGEAIQSGELGRVREKWMGESYVSYVRDRFGPMLLCAGTLLVALMLLVTLWHVALKRKVNSITLKLRDTEQRYRQLIESSPDMVFLINRTGRIRLANQSACDRLLLVQDQLTSTMLQDQVLDEDFDKFIAFLSELFASRPASLETELRDKQGCRINVEIAAALLRRGSEEERLACCFARDLTKRKRMERELIKAERLATMGKMAAGVAHEVNNPIGIILAHTEDLISGELDEAEMADSLKAIRRNALRAGNITETLLNPSSSEPPGKQVCDIAALAAECLTFLKPRLKNIHAVNRLEPERYRVRGNESQLQQVFVNLLLNAVESMGGRGTVRLRIEAHRRNNRVFNRLWLEDSGKGVPKKDRPYIFDPFFTLGKAGGVGLGLFVAERIIKKHGGKIAVDDSALGGAAVVIDLPRAEEQADAKPVADR